MWMRLEQNVRNDFTETIYELKNSVSLNKNLLVT